MAQVLEEPKQVQMTPRQHAAHILRTTKIEKCQGNLSKDGKMCATGVLIHEIYGWNGDLNIIGIRMVDRLVLDGYIPSYNEIICRNDKCEGGEMSFTEIADWLESTDKT